MNGDAWAPSKILFDCDSKFAQYAHTLKNEMHDRLRFSILCDDQVPET